MKADYIHKDTLTASDYFNLQKDNELIVSYNQQLLKEKAELKKQLHEASLTIQEMTERDIECPSNCEKLRQLKKQLENCYCNRTDCSGRIKDSKVYDSLVQKVKTQQKEFTNYLEDEIKTLEKDILETVDDMDIYMKQVKSLIIEEILQKYKSMIGVSDENNKQ